MAASVAAGAAEALADALTGAELVTRSDLAETTAELGNEIASTTRALSNEFAATSVELKNNIELLRPDITIKFGSTLVIAVGILLTAIRYFPPHP